MTAGENDRIQNIRWNFERIRDFASGGEGSEPYGIEVFSVINTVIVFALEAGDVALSGEIIGVVFMDVEMIWLEMANYGDVGGLIKIPELETGHFVNYDGILGKVI